MPTLKLPRMGFGTWKLKDKDCVKGVLKALEMGYRLIDTAQIYGNEREVGVALAEKTVDRKDFLLATKIWVTKLRPENVKTSAAQSLLKLQTEYVDILYVHWPAWQYNAKKTLLAFANLVDEGKVKYIGVSNFGPKLCDEAIAVCPKPIVVNQIETHPLLQQRIMRDYLKQHDMYLVAYSPLARGHIREVPTVVDIAKKHKASPNQVSLAWLMHHGAIPIPKATSESHIQDNFGAQDLHLDPEDIAQIDNIKEEKRFVNLPRFLFPKKFK
ncbi:MAG: aldehyde reductase [Promethearchaeota archaeon CR_4]|nr:MAG: aldehyde reductase [Candidatus Lokiarchaeota archaeon CR_4]